MEVSEPFLEALLAAFPNTPHSLLPPSQVLRHCGSAVLERWANLGAGTPALPKEKAHLLRLEMTEARFH